MSILNNINQKPHWYLYETYWCPLCCSVYETTRIRMYTPKPEDNAKRHILIESWDGCNI